MAFVIPVGFNVPDGVNALPGQPIGNQAQATIIGTPLPTGYLTWFSKDGEQKPFIEEQPGTPRIEAAEQCTCEHRLIMDTPTAILYWSYLPRGTVLTDSDANIWRVLSCEYIHLSTVQSELHYVMEALSFDTPPDTFSCHPEVANINIIKHPRYWPWLCPYQADNDPLLYGIQVGDTAIVSLKEIKECVIRMLQNYIESPFYPSANMTNSLIQVNIINAIQTGTFQTHYPNPTFDPTQAPLDPSTAPTWDGNNATMPTGNYAYWLVNIPPSAYADDDPQTGPIHMMLAAAQELLSKLWRQEDNPYLVIHRISLTQKFFQPVYLNPGGYQEDPRDYVPSYFMSPGLTWPPTNESLTPIPQGDQQEDPSAIIGDSGNPGSNLDIDYAPDSDSATIFDLMPQINPQCYSADGTTDGALNISSLRQADDWEYERTWFSITATWMVGCFGRWDRDLYHAIGVNGPQQVSDFNQDPVDQSAI